jgi:hypothetical protein
MVGDKESTKKSIVREIEHDARGYREHLPGRTAICTLEAVVRLKPAQQRDTQRDNSFIFALPSFFTIHRGQGTVAFHFSDFQDLNKEEELERWHDVFSEREDRGAFILID